MAIPCYWQFGCECSACQEDLYEFSRGLGLEPPVASAPADQPIDDRSTIDEYNTPAALEAPSHPTDYDCPHQERDQDYSPDLSTVRVDAYEYDSGSTTHARSDSTGSTQAPIQTPSPYEDSGMSPEPPQHAPTVLSYITSPRLADSTPNDQRTTEHALLVREHAIHPEPAQSSCGSPRGPADRPHMAHAASGDPPIICPVLECNGQRFGRLYEYERHYNGAHAGDPTVFWCTVVGCCRSEMDGCRPFPRKDKRNDHMRKVHRL